MMINIHLRSIDTIHLASSHTVSQIAKTLDYIPGSAFRGALAGIYLNKNKNPDDQFQRWFLHPAVHFNPLYPSLENGVQSFPLPATAYSCKFKPGFRKHPEKHGIKDMLLELLKENPQDTCSNIRPNTDDVCDAAMTAQHGFFIGDRNRELKIETSKRFITRTAIDNRRESASSSQLYTLEVIEEDQYFSGTIDLGDEIVEQAFVKWINTIDSLPIGAARTRGHGNMEIIDINHAQAEDGELSLAELNKRLIDFDRQVKRIRPANDGIYFCITLFSDAILFDEFMRCCECLTPECLALYVHPMLDNATNISTYCHNHAVDGWNNAHRLPKPTHYAIQAGSVFLFHIDNSVEQLAQWLKWLERDGIGERRQEGFGKVLINHSFHLDRREQ